MSDDLRERIEVAVSEIERLVVEMGRTLGEMAAMVAVLDGGDPHA